MRETIGVLVVTGTGSETLLDTGILLGETNDVLAVIGISSETLLNVEITSDLIGVELGCETRPPLITVGSTAFRTTSIRDAVSSSVGTPYKPHRSLVAVGSASAELFAQRRRRSVWEDSGIRG